jgi:TonB family protein
MTCRRTSLSCLLTIAWLLVGGFAFAQTSPDPIEANPQGQLATSHPVSPAPLNFDTITQIPIDILGDGNGVDLNPYVREMRARVRKNWYALIPYAPGAQRSRAVVEFSIASDGQLSDIKLVSSSGNSLFDKAALGGITLSNPLDPLPSGLQGKPRRARFYFDYYASPSALAFANSVRDVQAKVQENLENDPAALTDLEHDISVFTLLMETGSLNKFDELAARYYRAVAVSSANSIHNDKGQTMDLPAAQQALDDLDKVIANDADIQAWNVSLANAEYVAGGIAHNQLRSDTIAYSYWEKCSEKGHAGCINISATASVTGEDGEPVNFTRALDLHHRVFDTGTKFACAGAFSARNIASIVYFTGTRRPGDDELLWIRRSYNLSDRIEDRPKEKNRCDGANTRVQEFLYRLSRGERHNELLSQATARLDDDSPVDLALLQYISGSIDDDEFERAVQAGKTVYARCGGYFEGMWFAELVKKHAVAKKFYQRLLETGEIDCRSSLVYAKKFQF